MKSPLTSDQDDSWDWDFNVDPLHSTGDLRGGGKASQIVPPIFFGTIFCVMIFMILFHLHHAVQRNLGCMVLRYRVCKKREVYLKIKASPPSPLEFFLLNWLVSRCFLLGVPNFETILGGGFIFFGNFHPKNWGNDPI